MVDEKPIIIDGIDVSKCKYHRKCVLPDNIGCKIDDFLCCDKPNCLFKQLARYRKALEKIEEVYEAAMESVTTYDEQADLNITIEALHNISDIIDKAKGDKNEYKRSKNTRKNI